MTTAASNTEPGDPSNLNTSPAAVEDIVSVNKKGSSNNRFAKGIFWLLVGATLVGGLAWFSQNWLNTRKAQMKANSGPKAAEETTQVFNPEKTGTTAAKPKFGSDSGLPAPSQAAASGPAQSGAARDDCRPLRGANGKVMVNAQGRAMCVDREGNVVEVPAIAALSGDQGGRKPLPGEGAAGQSSSQAQQKPPSRYAGSLFVGDPAKPSNIDTAPGGDGTSSPAKGSTIAEAQAQQIAEILRNAGLGGPQASRTGAPAFTPPPGATPEQVRPGTIGSALYSSATPVAMATRMTDQNLILPKGRQADCILTGRIIDEVPGFTSCVLAQNLYSDNGRVLLLERGSELTGEYGVTNQLGLERLFVTWTRLKTPEGIAIELSSPGADRLGTSGIPGHLDNRWGARIGAAFLLSFVKDITVAIINKETQPAAGSTVSVQTAPGQNTLNASSSLAEEVIKQTIKVRPRTTINEGDRISIYVARDLDFSPVYALKTAGIAGATRLLSK
jgi:type IV secretion system protein VirB10